MQVSDNKYAQDGVNVPVGDAFSALVGKAAAATFDNNPFVEVLDLSRGLFRGPKPYRYPGLPMDKACFEGAPDGVGTKVVMHDALRRHRYAARDVLAMTSTDITRYGGLPLTFGNVLDVRTLGDSVESKEFQLFAAMLDELVKAAGEIGVVVHKGETAELGACVGTDNPDAIAPFNWAGFAHGVFFEDKIIMGQRVRPGDIVVALKEDGFRSNGISAVRKAFALHYGVDFYTNPVAEADLIKACEPSKLYDRPLNTAHGWYQPHFKPIVDLHLIAHISGGGIGKFTELLAPTGLSAVLDDLYELPEIMRKCAEWRGFSDRELYTTWNGGQGALVVLPPSDVEEFIRLARFYKVEAKPCGDIWDSTETTVSLTSKFNGEKLVFSHS